MRIVVAGGAGRMGRAVIEAVLAAGDLQLAGVLEAPGHPQLEQDAGGLVGSACGVRISADFASVIPQGECLVDFTSPDAALAHLAICSRSGLRAVIGTTGFSVQQWQRIEEAARRIPVVVSPNMAVGVNAVIKLADIAARILGSDFDVEIIEAHHRHKADAPSGTALRLGEVVAAALGRDLKSCAVHGREGMTGERDGTAIGFHAIRGGDIVGEHTVMFAGAGERVELTVRSASRMTYAQGALRACRFLMGKAPGLYDMQDVLGLR
jgi:4-hydroxy-tetrahydrodipicolinate reductase